VRINDDSFYLLSSGIEAPVRCGGVLSWSNWRHRQKE